MLRSLKDLEGYTANATDGDIGTVVNFLLDDERWIVRYLVIEPGSFLDGRQVLVSPISFRQAEWSTRRFHLALTKEKVRDSPSIDTDQPVSRQHEGDLSRYYGFPFYWRPQGLWGTGAYPDALATDEASTLHPERSRDVHLRSARDVRGYHIQGTDGAIGHVDDFIVDDETWEVRYLVVDTRNWWLDNRVLVSPFWASRISWDESKVYLDMSRQSVKDSPSWQATAAINRAYEARLHDHYGRPAYWASSDPPVEVGGVPLGGHRVTR